LGLSQEQRGLGRLKLAEVAHFTRDWHHFQGQRSRSRSQGHIVAASRTACLFQLC